MSNAQASVQSAETSLTQTELKNTQTSRLDSQKVTADEKQPSPRTSSDLSGAEDGQYADQVGSDEMAVDSAKVALGDAGTEPG